MNLVLARVFVVIVFNIIGPIRNCRRAFSLPKLKKLMIVHFKNFFQFIKIRGMSKKIIIIKIF